MLHICRIRNSNGQWITDQEDIANEAIHSYKPQLNGEPVVCDEGLLEHILMCITPEQRIALEAFLLKRKFML